MIIITNGDLMGLSYRGIGKPGSPESGLGQKPSLQHGGLRARRRSRHPLFQLPDAHLMGCGRFHSIGPRMPAELPDRSLRASTDAPVKCDHAGRSYEGARWPNELKVG